MKKILFAVAMFAMVCGTAHAEDDLELLSDEMLFAGGDTEAAVEEEAEDDKKTGIFGFITRFFGRGTNDSGGADDESYLEKSARLAQEGDVEAQMDLAYMYLYGMNGVEEDFAKSAQYYAMAAKQNNAIALNNLGSLYFNGIGVEKNVVQALSLFEQAAKLGNENAAINLAFINLTGGKKDPLRNARAIELLQKAQEKSNIAKFMLGYAYYRGFVVGRDYEKAFHLIGAAAFGDSRIDEAQLILARMYRYGLGTVQNYQKAVDAYRAASMQGNMEATMALAKVYAAGKICPQNLPMAHALLNIAASRNVPNAAKMRDDLVKKTNMKLETLTEAQTIAQDYQPSPSELTDYIRQTYGTDIRSYIDKNMANPVAAEAEE